MKKRVILVGKAASGKDHMRDMMVDMGLTPDVSATTRPPRDGEVNGRTYHFVDQKTFDSMKMYEKVVFNGWHYGTLLDSWKNSQLFIMTPSGVDQIGDSDRKDCLVVYIDIPMGVRRGRLIRRSDSDSVDRRIEADEKDFDGFVDHDIVVSNPHFDEDTVTDILSHLRYEHKFWEAL
jgi:guanylate kinase